jgi:hypothetical protein
MFDDRNRGCLVAPSQRNGCVLYLPLLKQRIDFLYAATDKGVVAVAPGLLELQIGVVDSLVQRLEAGH